MYDHQEKEISFKSMMFAVLYHWKSVVVVGLILAVLLGGYKGVVTSGITKDPSANDEAYQDYLLALSDYERAVARIESDISTLEQRIRDQEEFMRNSILMQLDSYKVSVVRARYYVSIEKPVEKDSSKIPYKPNEELLAAYKMLLGGESALETYAQKLGVEANYLKEIISISGPMDQGLEISVWHKDTASAEQILQVILENMEQTTQQITDSMGPHTIALIGTTSGTVVDRNIAKQQDENKNYLYSMQDELAEKNEKLKGLKAPAEIVETGRISKKTVFKGALLGGILGVVLMAGVYCCGYVFGDKVYSGEELHVRTGIRVLGVFAGKTESRDPIMRWLRKKERRAGFTALENQKLLARCVSCAGEKGRCILIAGGAEESVIQSIAETMQQILGAEYRILWTTALERPEAAENLLACDCVLLLEQSSVSRYSGVKHQMELAGNAGKPVIGALVAE